MRALALLLLVSGCRVSEPAPRVEAPPADAPTTLPAVASTPPPVPATDSLGRGPWGAPVSRDSLAALVAAVDTSASRTVALIGRTGVFHDGEVMAASGERWQALVPTADGVEVRSFRLRTETARDEVVDGPDDPPTGLRVSTPWSAPADGYGYPDDDALSLARRPGAPFPTGPVPTAFAGGWPVQSGRLALAFGERRYEFQVVEGPESVLMPQRETIRPDRVLLLVQDDRRQPISALIGGDAGVPALLWAGDLDGDGRLDLLLDETNHYNLSAPALFLSSEAAPGELVRRVARHEAVGC